jgi:FAD-dependent urate hydroxylase
MKALVIGAGIGGLALGRALGRDGHEVTVFERADELRTSGAALTLWSNGTAVLSALEVSTDGLGAPIDLLRQLGWDGHRLMDIDVSLAAAKYRHPHLSMPRRRLIERLASTLPEGTVVFGKRCVAVDQSPDGVRATFDDGSTAEGDVLAGADGYRSVVRDHLYGDPTTPSGWATWQGLTPVAVDVTTSRHGLMIVGPEGMCGLLPAGGGLLQWWFDLRHNPDDLLPVSPVAMLKERFGHWVSPVAETLAAADDADVEYFAHYRQKVPRKWGSGRITVLGDAAHTMPPTVAQGGNQALEDAWALARTLREFSDVGEALRMYERSRSRRAALAARVAATETTNKYLPRLSRMTPDAMVSHMYTRWLRQISTFLSADRLPDTPPGT